MGIAQADHPLFKVLKGHILHCTSVTAYKSICKDGFIRANGDSFPHTWGQTRGSCVHKFGGISLLDFGLPENKVFFVTDQENFSYPWESILTAHSPITIVVKINRDKILDKIITWDEIRAKTQECLLIPYTEVCCLEPIPIDTFVGLVAVRTCSKFVDISNDICSMEILNTLSQV